MTGITSLGNFTQTSTMMNHTMQREESNRFEELVKAAKAAASNDPVDNSYNPISQVSSNQILKSSTRLNGDIASDFSKEYVSEADKTAKASGFAVNSSKGSTRTIDKTSELYEKSLELESFFVKMMVDSMRKTVSKASGENNFAQKMYEDMLYDEYTTALTKNAGFGIADAIYLELSGK